MQATSLSFINPVRSAKRVFSSLTFSLCQFSFCTFSLYTFSALFFASLMLFSTTLSFSAFAANTPSKILQTPKAVQNIKTAQVTRATKVQTPVVETTSAYALPVQSREERAQLRQLSAKRLLTQKATAGKTSLQQGQIQGSTMPTPAQNDRVKSTSAYSQPIKNR